MTFPVAVGKDCHRDRVIYLMSSRKSTKSRKIDEFLENLQEGDMLLVSELSAWERALAKSSSVSEAVFPLFP